MMASPAYLVLLPFLNGKEAAGKACALGKMSDQQQKTDATAGPGSSSSSPSSRSRPQHLNLDLQPNYLDDPGTVLLPSFRDIRAKTLRALYGIQSGHHHPLQLFVDKSPKGSVDEAIRPLVDLLNAHPAYATLSSCSGRIALFDPSAPSSSAAGSADVDASAENVEADASNGAEVTSERDNATGSGKGSGRWALSSHGQIDPRQLIDLLNDNDNLPGTTDIDAASATVETPPTLMFKHEPLLLHVAASTLLRAEKLLSLALALGFRESGIVSTSKRVTVAIRGVGLGLTVPLARRGPLRPSDDYVRSLVGEANQRFVANEDKLRRLYELVERELFVPKTAGCGGDDIGGNRADGNTNDNVDMEEYEAIFEPLPKLGLWGHAAVKVLKLDTSSANDFDIDVFGGHGTGPHSGEGAKRSDAVYRIEHAYGRWSRPGDLGRGWERIPAMAGPLPDQFETAVINNIHLQHAALGAREGLAACLLPEFDFDWDQLRRSDHYSDICETLFNMRARLVAIFGGRGSPAQPSNELLVYTKDGCREDMFWRPTDVRGEPPAARWGHTFTALSGKNGRLAVLCGGRTTKGIVPTCHVLNVTPPGYEGARGGISHCHFLWETVKGEVSLFHHVSVRLPQQQNGQNQETIYIFGGKDDPANLFTSDVLDANDNASITTPTSMLLTVDLERSNHSITTLSHGMVEDDQLARIASSGCCIEDGSQSSSLIVVSGGIPSTPNTATSALSLCRAKVEGNKLRLEAIPVKCRLIDGGTSGKIDVGSLVRHTCISLESNPPSILLAGGGISSFAFGPSFAESYHVTFHPIRRNSFRGNISGLGTKATAPSASLKLPAKSTKESTTDVVYVEKPKAKELKNELEKAQLLDKNYRMIPADASSAPLDDASRYIAVPVSAAFAEMSPADAVSFSWFSLIAGRGRQTMPFSTKVLGNRHSTR